MSITDSIYNFFMGGVNGLLDLLYGFFSLFLPADPMIEYLQQTSFDDQAVLTGLGWLNWFVPVEEAMYIVGVSVSAIAAFMLFRALFFLFNYIAKAIDLIPVVE